MFYFNKKGVPIGIFNKRPRNYSAGGMIKNYPGNKHPDEDTISSLLEEGSLVIPKSVMQSGIMKKYGGPVTGPHNPYHNELVPTIVLPGELVVDKLYAPAVTKYLKSHGVTLPLPQK